MSVRSIEWSEFFRIEQDPMVTLQIIPDRTARNWRCDDLARALYEMYNPPLKRFTWGRWWLRYRPQERFSFDITMDTTIRFWLTVPARWEAYAKQQLGVIWPKATIKPGVAPAGKFSACAELHQKEHSFYALATAKNDNRPLNSLMEITRSIQAGDAARLQIIAKPHDRQVWEHDAIQAYSVHRQGRNLRRQEYTLAALTRGLMEFADAFCTEISKTLEDFVGVSENPVKTVKEGQASSADLFALRRKKNLSESTMQKITEPIFGVSIRIAAQSDDAARAQLITRNLASACNDLAGDNELIKRDVSAAVRTRFTRMVNEHQLPRIRTTYSVLSAAEVGKFMQIPGGELQDLFPAIEQIPLRETNLPGAVLGTGLQIGEVIYHGEKRPVYLPTSNLDELCLPHCVIGGMGTGKTMGFGANLAVEAVKARMGAVVIDPAKGELGDEIESALSKDQIIRIRFGRQPISLDWRECLHGERQRNRLANELVAFCEVNSDSSAGAQTLRYMRSAAKACTNGRLSEMVRILTDQKYRDKILPGMREQEQEIWQQFNECSEARQTQIATPVLNRLDIITGDDYLYDCMEAEKGLDFVELLSVPRAVILDIPKGELGTEAVDVLAALVATKLDLAMTLRESKHPVFIIQDEPHQYCRSARTWKSAAVESRKWRFSYVWMFHAAEQIPKDVLAIIKSALPHYHLYTSSQDTYRALASEIKPFDIEEAMATPMHWAINVIRAGGVTVSPFLAKMMAPPSKRKTK